MISKSRNELSVKKGKDLRIIQLSNSFSCTNNKSFNGKVVLLNPITHKAT